MGPIQSGINQAMSIAGLMFTQTQKFKDYQKNRELKRQGEHRKFLVAKSGFTEDELKMTTGEAQEYFKDDAKKLNDFEVAQHNIQGEDIYLSEKLGNEEATERLKDFRYRQGQEDLEKKIENITKIAQNNLSASQLEKRNTNIKF